MRARIARNIYNTPDATFPHYPIYRSKIHSRCRMITFAHKIRDWPMYNYLLKGKIKSMKMVNLK